MDECKTIMLKKLLIISIAAMIGVSPLLPRVFADSADWNTVVAQAAWDYDYYRVERLKLDDTTGPLEYNDVVYFTQTAQSCDYSETCDLVDLTILKDGESLEIASVSDSVTGDFWSIAQDGRFVYFVPSDTDDTWGVVYEYDAVTGSVIELTTIERNDNALAFMTLAIDGDRVYFSTLQSNEDTGDIESALSVYDMTTEYERDDFTYNLTAPLQEIVDVQDGLVLVKFQFDAGFQQLWLIDQTARSMSAIPETWTESPGEILGAHFTTDGVVQYFRNYRLFTFDSTTDSEPVDAGGAYLSWLLDPSDAIQFSGEVMAYVDDENGLYVSDSTGVHKFGVALEGNFTLENDAIYFQNSDGDYVSYSFSTGVWETRNYYVTDSSEDVLVGVDADGNVWYENLTNGYLMNVGYGNAPNLSDREHAYWQGADGNIYEVTFSALLDLERTEVEAFSSYTSHGVYLVSGENMWLIPDETTYYTWFGSFDDTLQVSQATIDVYLESYDFMGELKMAPGTRVKAASSSRVYVVGSDYKLHWITSETVADEVYGSDWNQDIVEVTDTYLWKYATGDEISSAGDVRTI
jgi:hypothetical protein